MKKGIIIIFSLIGIILIGKFTFENTEYKEYVPQIFNGNRIVEVPKMLTEKHKENVIKVLKFYKEKWKFKNGKVLVSREIDNEILWNYTLKANDSIWLLEHKVKE